MGGFDRFSGFFGCIRNGPFLVAVAIPFPVGGFSSGAFGSL